MTLGLGVGPNPTHTPKLHWGSPERRRPAAAAADQSAGDPHGITIGSGS